LLRPVRVAPLARVRVNDSMVLVVVLSMIETFKNVSGWTSKSGFDEVKCTYVVRTKTIQGHGSLFTGKSLPNKYCALVPRQRTFTGRQGS